MAVLKTGDGWATNDPAKIQQALSAVGIEYERWDLLPELGDNPDSNTILAVYADKIANVKQAGGYTKVDVVNVNPTTPNLDAMLAKFSTEHWHDEDEVRFTVQGRGLYHVHMPDDSVAALEVEPGDMIRVPRGTLHWFHLCGDRTIKAVRFFQDPAGWTPYYTESGLETKHEPVCLGPAFVDAPHISAWSAR